MEHYRWIKNLNAAITVCDRDGIIIEMNDKAIDVFAKDGGAALVGTNLLDCHPEPAKSKLRAQLASQQTNVYTIEKQGKHKIIYQVPWYDKGEYGGLVEIAFEIPQDMPHFKRG